MFTQHKSAKSPRSHIGETCIGLGKEEITAEHNGQSLSLVEIWLEKKDYGSFDETVAYSWVNLTEKSFRTPRAVLRVNRTVQINTDKTSDGCAEQFVVRGA